MNNLQKYTDILEKYGNCNDLSIKKHLVTISDIVWALNNLNTDRNGEWRDQLMDRLVIEADGL